MTGTSIGHNAASINAKWRTAFMAAQLYIYSQNCTKSHIEQFWHQPIYACHNYSPVMALICALCLFGVDSAKDEVQSHMVAAVAFAGERSGVCRDL